MNTPTKAMLPTRKEALAQLTAPGEPYALIRQHVRGREQLVFANAPATLGELFASTATDAEFIVFEDERFTFASALAAAAETATLLRTRFGVQKGDRVAISMRNYPEWITTFMAATSIGAIAVAMNALWQSDELAYGLEDCGAKVLFADSERLARLAAIKTPLNVEVVAVRAHQTHPQAQHLETLLAAVRGAAMPAVDVQPDEPAIIFYTSGSTGHPKGVVSSHRAVITALFSWELDGQANTLSTGITPPELPYQAATLLAVPLFHATGSHAVYLMSYRLQRKLVAMYKWDPAEAAALIEKERITSFVAPAAMTGDLVRIARETGHDLSTLQTVGGGGAPRAPEQVKQISNAFGRALPNTGWGMTETNAIGTGIGGHDYLNRPASSGRCSAVLELKVVDEQGNALPAGERGELLIRGTSLFQGYWNRPEVNAEIFVDGWFRTGDVAYLDDEGYLFIVDRIKDLIIRGGENIGCGQVEAALLTHPAVMEAAVYAVPDERLGEEVGATVYSTAEVNAEQLRDYLSAHLAKFEIPRYIDITAAPLPRTASGKILKRELRDATVSALGLQSG